MLEATPRPRALNDYCVNLNEKAAKGRIDPLIGRAKEIHRTIQVLCRRQKKQPLLVGDPGVGKTAIAEGLARLIFSGDVPGSTGALDDFSAGYGIAIGRNTLSW